MEERALDLATISSRTGLPRRRVRYVLDHHLVGPTPESAEGRGNPRVFGLRSATLIAVAGLMLDAGLRRDAVVACAARLKMKPIIEDESPGYADMMMSYSGDWVHRVDVGDGKFIRFWTRLPSDDQQCSDGDLLEGAWQSIPEPGAPDNDVYALERAAGREQPGPHYVPTVLVRIDVAQVRKMLF